jgi:N-acetylglucosaminyldiphosphoundecaprenol N-acetyl-beta-D-mannosaminyltransferase
LCEAVQKRFPSAYICGAISPPFGHVDEHEWRKIAAEVNAARPDIVWVGLGAPRQELWMHAHRRELDAPALIGVGAVFDFASGCKKRAPAWMRRSGLEWFFRLMQEPLRLGPRYVFTNSRFLLSVLYDRTWMK